MKIQYILSTLFLLLSIGTMAQKKEHSGQMQITPLVLEQKGDSLYLKLNIDIDGVNVASRRSISLIPSLVTPDNHFNFPTVEIKGRENYNVHMREMALMSKQQAEVYIQTAPYAILKGFTAKDSRKVEYYKVIKYDPWMADAKLNMYEDLCGCGNTPRRMGDMNLAEKVTLEKTTIIEPYSITPYFAYIQPEAEAVKKREVVGEAFLDFVVNKIDIRPDYMNNPRELKKITDLITEVKNDPSITVLAINVDGFASPEGGYAYNKYLSEGRAKALVNYLIPKFNFPEKLYQVHFGGENWTGLKEMVQKSEITQKEGILAILNDEKITDEQRKNALKRFAGGSPYAFMLKEWYPQLRKASCKLEFEVKGFDIAEAKKIVKSRPQNLSLNEMFLVAGTYPKGSQDFIDLFETAARIFPDDVTANINAASAALSRGELIYAKRYLDSIKTAPQTPEYYNTTGVHAMLSGEYDRAEELLRKAVQMGSDEAKKNLNEISLKRENMIQIEEQKSKKNKVKSNY